ncbi:MAG TPA: class I SAM-dependent methyltransferase [Candidatus Dormibacteraeota bacterium]|nr:class I SAM-dependent methyltransferase [Candidatus Dormibacteraeota bacterium]
MNVPLGPNPSGVADEVLSVLRCLSCRGRLDDHGNELACAGCGRKYPRVNGVIRFVDAQHYAGSFGFQWHVHARTQLDTNESNRSERAFRKRTGFRPEDLAGKLVLDVGCGMGRFADVATRWGAHVVGIDLSLAAEVAATNLADRKAAIFQADVFQLPFAPESFDFIYSIGVLHHTPDCERAFKVLPSLLKPGGRIAIWLYSGYNAWYKMSDVYRKVTRRLPPRLLHALCYGVVPLYGIHVVLKKIPLVGRPASGALAYAIPMAFHPDRRWRILDTFDWYSPWYQSKHTYEEVFRWFESCGLEDLRVIEQPIAVQGRRPLVPAPLNSQEEKEISQCAG